MLRLCQSRLLTEASSLQLSLAGCWLQTAEDTWQGLPSAVGLPLLHRLGCCRRSCHSVSIPADQGVLLAGEFFICWKALLLLTLPLLVMVLEVVVVVVVCCAHAVVTPGWPQLPQQ